MKKNLLRQKLNDGQPTVSTHIHSTWPSIVEAIGHTHMYDYVEFVAAYAPSDLHDLDNLCRAGELHNLGMMIKVDQNHQAYLAQRGIGSGFDSVLFTNLASPEDVEECIRIAAPDTLEDNGLYGAETRRNSYMGYIATAEYVQSVRDIVVAIMIEQKKAVDCLEDILSVPGIDMVQWGPADYSMSSGRVGERNHPEVIAARNKVFKMAIDRGIAARVEIESIDEAKEYLDMGVRHFSIGTDFKILFSWWKENGEKLQKLISEA